MLQGKGEAAHPLPLFQGCMEQNLTFAAVNTAVVGGMGRLSGRMVAAGPCRAGCSVLHIL